MASTLTISQTLDWCDSIVKFQPLDIGWFSQPSLTNANTILQTILGPPFAWKWNRATKTFNTASGTQDYPQSVPDFGFLETVSVTLSGTSTEIGDIKLVLGLGSETSRPNAISAQVDDNAGNITFRFLPVPDAVYAVTATYQKKAALLSTLSSNWSPIPDEYSYIYNYGLLALSMLNAGDERFPIINQKFVSHLLGANEGLTETQRNLFIQSWSSTTQQINAHQLKTQSGAMVRQGER